MALFLVILGHSYLTAPNHPVFHILYPFSFSLKWAEIDFKFGTQVDSSKS